MRHLAAYLLATLAGSENPSQDEVKKIITSVGVEVEEEALARLFSELEGKSVDQLIAEGSKRLASFGSGGGAAAASGATAPAGGAGDAGAAAPEKKKEEEEEEADLSGGMDMFGGGGDADY